jgi:hypothetical protein
MALTIALPSSGQVDAQERILHVFYLRDARHTPREKTTTEPFPIVTRRFGSIPFLSEGSTTEPTLISRRETMTKPLLI